MLFIERKKYKTIMCKKDSGIQFCNAENKYILSNYPLTLSTEWLLSYITSLYRGKIYAYVLLTFLTINIQILVKLTYNGPCLSVIFIILLQCIGNVYDYPIHQIFGILIPMAIRQNVISEASLLTSFLMMVCP